jgi:hypothetical protein
MMDILVSEAKWHTIPLERACPALTHTHAQTNTYTHTLKHTQSHTQTHTHTLSHTHRHTSSHTHAKTRTDANTYTMCMCTSRSETERDAYIQYRARETDGQREGAGESPFQEKELAKGMFFRHVLALYLICLYVLQSFCCFRDGVGGNLSR